jgi:hypothetical protein
VSTNSGPSAADASKSSSNSATSTDRANSLLVEAKTVRANPESAVREAIGQLLAYEFVFYSSPVTKVALFSAPIGDLWIDLLSRLSIACVWLDGPQWRAVGEPVAWVAVVGGT